MVDRTLQRIRTRIASHICRTAGPGRGVAFPIAAVPEERITRTQQIRGFLAGQGEWFAAGIGQNDLVLSDRGHNLGQVDFGFILGQRQLVHDRHFGDGGACRNRFNGCGLFSDQRCLSCCGLLGCHWRFRRRQNFRRLHRRRCWIIRQYIDRKDKR